jgi:hypothetical protein
MENHSILAGGDTIIPLYYTSKIGMIATITGGIFILILLSHLYHDLLVYQGGQHESKLGEEFPACAW